jgi:hypothetical protein
MLNSLISIWAATSTHAKPAVDQALSPAEALTATLTMEGLLFAAFSVGYKLTGVTRRGRSTFFTQARFGWCIVGVIALVAAGAGASWWEIFGSGWPENLGSLLLGAGLAVGIVAQPILAGVINHQSRKE